MLPILRALAGGDEISLAELRARIAAAEGLTDEDVRELLPSQSQSKFTNRVSWAIKYLGHAGLTEKVRRGVYRVSAEGEALLADPPPRVDMNYLRRYPAYVAWRSGQGTQSPIDDTDPRPPENSIDTPEEALEKAARFLRRSLEAEVLDRVRNAEPDFLEKVVVDLLIAMGYGGGDNAQGRVTGSSGDGGIDGTIREDALGLDEVYLQAKRYGGSSPVGAGDLRNFAGAIDAAGTTKGVFVTTASFTSAARDYVARSPKRIVLIDGAELARLMVEHGIGVRTRNHYEIKRIDEDYFDQEAL